MDTIRVAVAALRTKRDKLQTEVDGLNAAITALGGAALPSAKRSRGRKRRTLTPEQIAKMQAGRRAAREGKTTDAPEPSPIEETRRRRAEATADTGHAQVSRGASLAEAAS